MHLFFSCFYIVIKVILEAICVYYDLSRQEVVDIVLKVSFPGLFVSFSIGKNFFFKFCEMEYQ